MRASEELLPCIEAELPASLVYLANVKNWLCSPGTESYCTEDFGNWLTPEGAQRALGVILWLDSQFFPRGKPALAVGGD